MSSGFTIYKTSKRFQTLYKFFVTACIFLGTIFAIAYLLLINGSVIARFTIGLATLGVAGHVIARTNGIQDTYGAYLLGGKHGIKLITALSKRNKKFWIAFADWGIAFSFGLLSYFFFRKYINNRTLMFGIATILAIVLFVYTSLPVVLSFINIPQLTSRIPAGAASSAIGINPLSLVIAELSNPFFDFILISSVIGGFGLLTVLVILYSGGSILYATLLFAVGVLSSHPNPGVLSGQLPGVAPLIPGITIPLFAGAISLAMLLIVHEFSHGILAKIAKVRIKSVGIILLGIIPMGAFVDPDEREVKKLKTSTQDRISIAGISANMLTSLLFFVVTFAMISYILPNVSTNGVMIVQEFRNYSAYGLIPPNSTILRWNNYTIRNAFDLAQAEASYKPGTQVSILTNQGSFILTPNAEGRIGIITAPGQMTFGYQTASFLYAVAALSFGLNFFVAIFNLLPIPAFDGWRIYQNRIKNKKLLKAISSILIIAILLNILPWLWILQ